MFKYTECKIKKLIEITSVISAFEYDYGNDYIFKGETHDFLEIMFIKKGKISLTIDNKVFNLDKNKLILFKPNEFHSVSSCGEPFSLLIISFNIKSPIEINNTIFSLNIEERNILQSLLSIAKECFVFDKFVIKDYKQDSLVKVQLFINKLEMFLLNLMQEKDNSACQINNIVTTNFAKIVDIMKNNLDKNLTVNDIASLANMSPSNAKKTFSLFVNQGMINYYNHIKILEATNLLKQGVSVGTIATRLGFLEQNYFSNVFKKFTGYSPKFWLKQQKEL